MRILIVPKGCSTVSRRVGLQDLAVEACSDLMKTPRRLVTLNEMLRESARKTQPMITDRRKGVGMPKSRQRDPGRWPQLPAPASNLSWLRSAVGLPCIPPWQPDTGPCLATHSALLVRNLWSVETSHVDATSSRTIRRTGDPHGT